MKKPVQIMPNPNTREGNQAVAVRAIAHMSIAKTNLQELINAQINVEDLTRAAKHLARAMEILAATARTH